MALYYFAYGANMDVADLSHRCDMRRRNLVRFISSRPAMLKGYRLVFNVFCPRRESGILNLVPAPKKMVHGVLHELPAGDVIAARDFAEGAPHIYRIHTVTVTTAAGKEFPAAVLMADVRKKALYRPAEAYVQLIAAAARRHRLPSSWVDRLTKCGTGVDV